MTLEQLIKEVQGHNMQRVFKKDGEPTKDGWRYYEKLIDILYMVKHLINGDDDEFDDIVHRIEEILIYEDTTDKAKERIRERLYG